MARKMTVTQFASLGGKARSQSLTKERRSQIAKKAGKAAAKARREKQLASKMAV